MFNARFEDMHRGGWDPEARLGDQDRDGVHGEVLYPTVGHPDRLFGVGQTAMRGIAV